MTGREKQQEHQDPMQTGGYYQQSRKSGRLLFLLALFVTLSLLGFIAYDSFLSDGGFKRIEALKTELELKEAELLELQDQHLQMQEAIRRLKTDPTAVEEVAREQLGFIKPGERVYILSHVPEVPIKK